MGKDTGRGEDTRAEGTGAEPGAMGPIIHTERQFSTALHPVITPLTISFLYTMRRSKVAQGGHRYCLGSEIVPTLGSHNTYVNSRPNRFAAISSPDQ